MSPVSPRRSLAAGILLAVVGASASAQQPVPAVPAGTRPLSLDDALSLAARESEALRIAQAGISRSQGQVLQSRSGFLPQANASLNYQRTIQSQFVEITRGSTSAAPPDTGAPAPENPITKIFASPNSVIFGLTLSQTLFSGGRLRGQMASANAGRRAADYGLSTAVAQLKYDVAQAYFDAIVADGLVVIADSSLQQAERSLRQTTIARQVGSSAEFDLLRARVARDNIKPQLYSALSQQETAYARLASLLNLPLDQPLQLTTPIVEPDTAVVAAALAANFGGRVTGNARLVSRPMVALTTDSAATARTAVKQLAEQVAAQQGLYSVARAQRIPSLSISTNYQRFGYPGDDGSGWSAYFPNWTASASLSYPLFTGGRITGDIEVANANLIEAQQRLQQAREAAAIESRQALNELRQAQASYISNVGTDDQAAKAYRIAEVRYTEGVSTQLELIETRNQLVQARANRAVAARNLALAQLKLSLLKDLPLSQGGGQAAAGAMQSMQQGAPGTPGGAARQQTSGAPPTGAQAQVSGQPNQE